MTQRSPHVAYSGADVARLEGLVEHLASGARVRLRLTTGQTLVGLVADAPVLQLCETPAGARGSNAVLRLERCRAVNEGLTDLWIDEIAGVEQLTDREFEMLALPAR